MSKTPQSHTLYSSINTSTRFYNAASEAMFELVHSTTVPAKPKASAACQGCVAQNNPDLCKALPPSCITLKAIWVQA